MRIYASRFGIASCVPGYFRSILPWNETPTPAQMLAAAYSEFHQPGAFERHANTWVEREPVPDESEDDKRRDAEAFRAALARWVPVECGRLLHQHRVSKELEHAKSIVLENVPWSEYAADVQQTIELVARECRTTLSARLLEFLGAAGHLKRLDYTAVEVFESAAEMRRLTKELEQTLISDPGALTPADLSCLSFIPDIEYQSPDGWPGPHPVDETISLQRVRELAGSRRNSTCGNS
jgi:hypothetical protein